MQKNTCKIRRKQTRRTLIELYRHLRKPRWITTDRDALHKKIKATKLFDATRRERRDLYHDSYKQSKLLIYFLKSILNYNYISELRTIMPGTSGLSTRGSFWFPTQRESIFFQISVRKRFRDRRFLAKHDSTTTWFQGWYEMKLYEPQFI